MEHASSIEDWIVVESRDAREAGVAAQQNLILRPFLLTFIRRRCDLDHPMRIRAGEIRKKGAALSSVAESPTQ
jgi:hypothetical protein